MHLWEWTLIWEKKDYVLSDSALPHQSWTAHFQVPYVFRKKTLESFLTCSYHNKLWLLAADALAKWISLTEVWQETVIWAENEDRTELDTDTFPSVPQNVACHSSFIPKNPPNVPWLWHLSFIPMNPLSAPWALLSLFDVSCLSLSFHV